MRLKGVSPSSFYLTARRNQVVTDRITTTGWILLNGFLKSLFTIIIGSKTKVKLMILKRSYTIDLVPKSKENTVINSYVGCYTGQ